jgi:putative Holliday junction resolvase
VRVLGIDYGDSHIGLAVSDKLLLTAQALGSYRSKSKKEDKKYFKELVSKYEIGEIVLGFPLRMDGSQGTRVEKTKEFAAWLKKILKIPIIFWDERLTTREAHQILGRQKIKAKRKKTLEDQIAASVILSSYLESKRVKNHANQNH